MAGRVSSNLQSGPAVKCMKTLLTVFNFIFWVSGIAILALGIWTKVELHQYMEFTEQYHENTPYVLIGVGAIIVVIGSCGCCCTIKGNACLLYMYALFLMLVFLAEMTVAILAFLYKDKLEDEFHNGLKSAMNKYKDDDDTRHALDDLQEHGCCGNDRYDDWFDIAWEDPKAPNSVPTSCCIKKEGCVNENLPPYSKDVTNLTVYVEGCHSQLVSFTEENFGIIGGVAIGIAFLQLFGAILACCLAKNINKLKYESVA